MLYQLLVGIADEFTRSGKLRRRLARRLNCAVSMVPDTLVCYTAIYSLLGLIMLLCMRGLVLVFTD